MKKLLFVIFTASCIMVGAGELEDAYKNIPEIMKDHGKVIDVIWNLSKTNQFPFIVTMNKALRSYAERANYPNSKALELYREFDKYYYIATNPAAPTTSLRVDWNKQLTHQNMLGLKDMNVRSDPETTDFNRDASNPSGVEIITTPFDRRPIPADRPFLRRNFEPTPYCGQW